MADDPDKTVFPITADMRNVCTVRIDEGDGKWVNVPMSKFIDFLRNELGLADTKG